MISLKPFTVDEFGVKNWNNLFLLSLPVFFIALLVFIGSSFIFDFEVASNSAITSKEDSAWLSWMALTTVGFGEIFPITTEGRIAVGLLAGLGICTFAAIGNFVSLLVFSRFDTEVQNRELRKQNAEIIRTNNIAVETNLDILKGIDLVSRQYIELDNKFNKILAEIEHGQETRIGRNRETRAQAS